MSKGSEAGGPPGREELLDAVIAEYLEALESGKAPDRNELIARHPDLARDLEAFFANKDFIDRLRPKFSSSPETPPPAKTFSLAAGSRFRDYEILEEIARGGMGTVYKARKTGQGGFVALKMIRADAFASPESVARFKFEAEAAAGLDHSAIVPLYEIGESEGYQYYSMKFIEGGNLAGRMPYPAADFTLAARLMMRVAQAVHYAHTRGVLHRDLKPGNILLDADGNPFVSDFGLAKRIEGGSALTQSGVVIGTPSYMSPEQAGGKRDLVTTATDIYSLGAILYEILTGRPPHRAETPIETLHQVVREDPLRPSLVEPRVPRDLETICLKCLEKDARRRYASALELSEDLRRFLDGETIHAQPATSWERCVKWTRRRPAAAALVLVSVLALSSLLTVCIWYNAVLRSQAREYKAQELLARRYVYATRMNMAFDEMATGNMDRVVTLLKSLVPGPGSDDLRSFDWYYLWRLSNQDLFTLEGHRDIVIRIAFSPDSRILATGSYDGAVKLWETATGKEVADLRGPPSHVDALAISPDGKTLAAANEDFLVRLWDLERREIRAVLRGHFGTVTSIAFSPDGKILATASGDRTARFWDPVNEREMCILGVLDDTVQWVEFSPDGRWIAAAAHDSIVRLWDRVTREPLFSLDLHAGPALSASFSMDSKILAIGCWDGTVRFLDVHAKAEIHRAKLHDGPAWAVNFDPESMNLISGGSDHILVFSNGRTGGIAAILKGHADGINAAAFSPDGRLVATGSNDRTAKIWDSSSSGEPYYWDGLPGMVTGAVLSGDGGTLFTGCRSGILIRSSLDPRGRGPALRETSRIDLETAGKTLFRLSPDGNLAVSMGEIDAVRIWTLLWEEKRAAPSRLQAHSGRVTAAGFSPDSKILVSAGEDGTLMAWDRVLTRGGYVWQERKRQAIPAGDISDLEVSSEGSLVALARGGEPTVIIWDLAKGKSQGALAGHWMRVIAMAFSPDSRTVATGSLDLTARLWNFHPEQRDRPWSEWRIFQGHMNAVASLAFSPDGIILATGSDDHRVRLWDMANWEKRAEFQSHRGDVEGILFTPDGRAMITVGGTADGGEVRVWRAASDEDVARRR